MLPQRIKPVLADSMGRSSSFLKQGTKACLRWPTSYITPARRMAPSRAPSMLRALVLPASWTSGGGMPSNISILRPSRQYLLVLYLLAPIIDAVRDLQLVPCESLPCRRRRLLHRCVSAGTSPLILSTESNLLARYDIFAINIGAQMLGYVYGKGHVLNTNQDLGVKVATPIGSLIGQLLFGWLADVVGRKRMCRFPAFDISVVLVLTRGFRWRRTYDYYSSHFWPSDQRRRPCLWHHRCSHLLADSTRHRYWW